MAVDTDLSISAIEPVWPVYCAGRPARAAIRPVECLERRATGGPGPLQGHSSRRRRVLEHKWEREHPAWPSAEVVYQRVGSFRELPVAAGFEAPGPITIPFAERVATARRYWRPGCGGGRSPIFSG